MLNFTTFRNLGLRVSGYRSQVGWLWVEERWPPKVVVLSAKDKWRSMAATENMRSSLWLIDSRNNFAPSASNVLFLLYSYSSSSKVLISFSHIFQKFQNVCNFELALSKILYSLFCLTLWSLCIRIWQNFKWIRILVWFWRQEKLL